MGQRAITPNNNDVWQTDISLTLVGATLASLLANDKGFFFAADLCNGSTSSASCSSGQTGFAGAGAATSVVPLPPAALLFGTALVGLGVSRTWPPQKWIKRRRPSVEELIRNLDLY